MKALKKLALVLSLLSVAAAAGAFAHHVSRGGGRAGAPPAQGVAELEAGSEMTARLPTDLIEAGAPSPARPISADKALPQNRERPEREPLAGLLRGIAPGSEAQLTWTALLPGFEGLRYPTAIDLERLRAASVSTTCDATGRFAFTAVPAGALDGDSVVWITGPGREASSAALGSAEAGWRWPATGEAPARDAVRVIVQRAGEPVAGVSLRHTLSFWEAGQSEQEKRLRRVFLRETETGADGSAILVPGSGDNLLLATVGDERTISWLGKPEKEIVLELLPTIEVSGRVIVDGPAVELDKLRYHVNFLNAEDGSDFLQGGTSMGVRSDGSFGPDPWPRGERTRIQVVVSGGEIVPARATASNPPPGGSVSFEIATQRGYPFEVAVAMPEGQPVQGALLLAWHWSGSAWLPMASQVTGEDGRATVHAGAGELMIEVRKPSFTTWSIQGEAGVIVPQAAPPLRVIMRPAGVVEGLVRRGIEPVKRFSVLAWNDDKSYHSMSAFEEEEGAFRLEDVPKGETIHLFAYSEALPQSETAAFVLGEEALEVELELPSPRKARGRVIDSVTREPVAAARIHHLLTGMGGLADYRGEGMGVQTDGRFELDGFFPGRGGFACFAEGYEDLFYTTREDDSAVIDVGLLALNPMALLELQAREAGVSDFSGYQAWNRSNSGATPVALASDGSLLIPSRTGCFQVFVARPDGNVTQVIGSLLPGERKRVVLDFSSGIELVVVLDEPPADVGSWSACAFTGARDSEHWAKSRWSVERQAFVLRPLCPGDAVLELRDAEGALVTQHSARLSDSPQQTLTLPLGGERRRLRLVNERGAPWSSVPVTVTLENASGWSTLLETDARGEFEVGPLDARRVVLSAKLANESLAYGIVVELEPDPARTTVVALDVGPRSLLSLKEQGRPVAGLGMYYAHDLGVRQLAFGYISDEAGLVRGPFLGPGIYTVHANHQDFWPTRYEVTSGDSPDPVTLELYSRSTLEIELTTLAGRPVPGARLALEHAELAQTADDWLAADLLRSTTGLFTDAAGRLVLRGLPRGTYSWVCTAESGASVSGTAQLSPRQSLALPIRLGEE